MGRQTAALRPAQAVELTRSVTFEEPGYYRVFAAAVTSNLRNGRTHEFAGDTVIVNDVEQTVWVLVMASGGHLTEGYDPSIAADTTRYLSHGAYGAFRPRPTRATPSNLKISQSRSSSSSLFVGPITGRVTYINRDNGGAVVTGVAHAIVAGSCYDADFQPTYSSNGETDDNGYFSVGCFDDATGFGGNIWLDYAATSIRGREGVTSGGYVFIGRYENPTLQVANDNAVKVFINYRTYAAQAPSVFGRSRSGIEYWVSEGPAYGTNYNSSEDRIRIGPTSAWNDYGTFTAVHEYGHAFQSKAVESWNTYYCSPDGTHSLGGAYTRSCAYVEGFADFFAAALVNPSNTFFGPNIAETNPYRSFGDGVIIEATVASQLIDLFDGPGTNDLIAGDDETMQMTGGALLDAMSRCSPDGVLRLDGMDQLLACLEQNASIRQAVPASYQGSWRTFSSIQWSGAVPTLPAQTSVRTNWLYNYYNTGSTP